jgi:YD repeat-containing protein
VASRQASSGGDTLITLYKYPHHFLPAVPVTIADPQLKYLYEENILGKPIEITSYLKKKNATDSMLTGASWYEYDSARIKRIYKIPVQTPLTNFAAGYLGATGLVKDGRYELEAAILAMDTWGNPLTVQEKAGTTAMVWDAQRDVLTAKVAGAAADDVAYTSFEYDEKGNWNIPSPARDAAAAITGKKSYALANGAITKAADAGKTYAVSLWATTNAARVNGATPTRTGATANGFTLYEWTVSGAAQITVSGTGSIDELRLHPQGALMNTYTYLPLTGISAMADANGNIVYYEYDALGRLKLNRNRNGNIIKQYDYQYQIPVTPNLQ